MTILRSLLFFSLVFLELSVQATQLEGPEPLLSSCRELLETALPALTQGEPRAVVGDYEKLARLLQDSGAGPDEASFALSYMHNLLELHRDDESVDYILKSLAQMRSDNNQVLFCMLKPGCRLHGDGTLHFVANPPFGIGPSDSRSLGPNGPYHVILTNSIQEMPHGAPLFWATGVISELSQYVDTELVSEWVTANMQRLKRNEQPDSLFEKFVVVSNGRPIVDRSFLYTFLHSRSARVASVTVPNTSQVVRQATNFYMRMSATTTLFKLRKMEGSPKLGTFLWPGNIFELGLKWGRQMRSTIQMNSI